MTAYLSRYTRTLGSLFQCLASAEGAPATEARHYVFAQRAVSHYRRRAKELRSELSDEQQLEAQRLVLRATEAVCDIVAGEGTPLQTERVLPVLQGLLLGMPRCPFCKSPATRRWKYLRGDERTRSSCDSDACCRLAIEELVTLIVAIDCGARNVVDVRDLGLAGDVDVTPEASRHIRSRIKSHDVRGALFIRQALVLVGRSL